MLSELDRLFRNPKATRKVSSRVHKSLVRTANRDFATLWPAIQSQGEAQGQLA